jgi:hypothetical protein
MLMNVQNLLKNSFRSIELHSQISSLKTLHSFGYRTVFPVEFATIPLVLPFSLHLSNFLTELCFNIKFTLVAVMDLGKMSNFLSLFFLSIKFNPIAKI